MKIINTLLITHCLATAILAHGQLNTPLTRYQVRALASRCAVSVHPDTIEAIIRQESAYHPYALSINHPATEASRQGYQGSLYQLAQQPRDEREALAWTKWLLRHGHTVSIGLMQINTEMAPRLGINNPLALFNPCLNLWAGAQILSSDYMGQPHTLQGLANAFALYNSGSIAAGTRNGYASGVISKAPPLTQYVPRQLPKDQSP
jgi:type IV secretion system protein VirB1